MKSTVTISLTADQVEEIDNCAGLTFPEAVHLLWQLRDSINIATARDPSRIVLRDDGTWYLDDSALCGDGT